MSGGKTEHQLRDEDVDAVIIEIRTWARSIADGTINQVDADAQRAEMCTRLGPSTVRVLDALCTRALKDVGAFR